MDDRRKRLKFQANHRGMKETDLILGSFCEKHLSSMTGAQLDQFEDLLNAPDQALYAWLTGREAVPARFDTEMMTLLKAFEFQGKSSYT